MGLYGAALLFLCLARLPAFAQSAPRVEWLSTVAGSAISSVAGFAAAAADGRGSAFLVGVATSDPPSCDGFVQKVSVHSGRVEWQRRLDIGRCDGFASDVEGQDPAVVVAVGPEGDPVVAGHRFAAVKLDSEDGREVWRQEIRGAKVGGEATAIAIDRFGDVHLAGFTDGLRLNDFRDDDLTVVKLSGSSGNERWRYVVAGTPNAADPDDPEPPMAHDRANALAVDEAGRVFVTGTVERDGAPHLFVASLNASTGEELWRRSEDEVGEGHAVLATPDGEALVFAVVHDPVQRAGFQVLWLRAESGEVRTRLQSPAGDGMVARPNAVALAEVGDNEFVALSDVLLRSEGASQAVRTLRVFRLGRTEEGVLRWRRDVPGVEPSRGRAILGVDGRIYVAGYARASASSLEDPRIRVVALDSAAGETLWDQHVGEGTGSAWALVPGDAGGVVVAGHQTVPERSGSDPVAFHLGAADGDVVWSLRSPVPVETTDIGLGVASDPHGRVFATGAVQNAGTADDPFVARFDPASGDEMWRLEAPRLADVAGVQSGRHVVWTPRDALVVTAEARAGGEVDFVVAALDPVDGSELWAQPLRGLEGRRFVSALGFAVDERGDLVQAGAVQFDAHSTLGLALKRDGGTGTVLWEHGLLSTPRAVAVDRRSADVYVAEEVFDPVDGRPTDLGVTKLYGTDGSVAWEARLPPSGDQLPQADTILDGPHGPILVGGFDSVRWVIGFDRETGDERWRFSLGESLLLDARATQEGGAAVAYLDRSEAGAGVRVVRLGSGGRVRWRQTVVGDHPMPSVSGSGVLVVGPDGDVRAALPVRGRTSGEDIAVVRLSGRTGKERWRRVLRGTEEETGIGDVSTGIALRNGLVLVTGALESPGGGRHAFVAAVSDADGTRRCAAALPRRGEGGPVPRRPGCR